MTYWNGKDFVPYPPLVEQVGEAIWKSYQETLDPHVRPLDPWDIARKEPRHGIYEAAIAAIKVIQPDFELPRS